LFCHDFSFFIQPIAEKSLKPPSLNKFIYISIAKPFRHPYDAPPFPTTKESFMSMHRSLKGSSQITSKRNVLKRFERVELLKKRGLYKTGDKVIGLPKTKPAE